MTLALQAASSTTATACGGNAYPVFKNFYGGGIGSVRGYESSSLGVVDPTTGDALGGAKRVIGNAELQFPFPGSGTGPQPALVRASSTAARSTRKARRSALNELRYSAGIGLSLDFPGRSAQVELC